MKIQLSSYARACKFVAAIIFQGLKENYYADPEYYRTRIRL